jgi:hypothetical protein
MGHFRISTDRVGGRARGRGMCPSGCNSGPGDGDITSCRRERGQESQWIHLGSFYSVGQVDRDVCQILNTNIRLEAQ